MSDKEVIIKDVEYQEGTVVSKQVIKKKSGNVTLFAFDKGESLSEHTAPFDALVNVTDGEMEITVGGKPYTVKAGGMILMPQNIPHALVAKEKAKMTLVMIKETD